MPTLPIEIIRRVPRLLGQRWLVDLAIHQLGPDWDQGRTAYMAAACGHDSQGVFAGLRTSIKTYNDIAREFMRAGRGQELRALAMMEQGHARAARECFFTAATLYGGAQWPIQADTPLNRRLNDKRNACYDAYIPLEGRRIERVDVPFGGRECPALFHLPPGYQAGSKLPCAVVVSGMDGWKELSVAMDGDKWLDRGFAVLALDVPGQGESLSRGIWFDPDTFGAIGPAAYRWCASRPEVDPAKVVTTGLSLGSYWATALTAAEPRFLACGVAMTCFEPSGSSLVEAASPTFKLRMAYMLGAETEAEVDAKLARLDPMAHAGEIRCPLLIAAGEDDQLCDPSYTFAFLHATRGEKAMILYEGEDHGLHGARSGRLGPDAQTWVVDWLADRVAGKGGASLYAEVDSSGQVHLGEWRDDRRYEYGLTDNLERFIFGDPSA